MSRAMDLNLKERGTRFKLFVQPRGLQGFSEPETIWVSPSPSQISEGPADNRLFVIDALNKTPFGGLNQRSEPFMGERNPPIQAGSDGHFDHFPVDSREFLCATMYATVRRCLDIWEDFLGHELKYHFRAFFDRLLLIPLVEFGNAQSGFGFLEFGFGRKSSGALDVNSPYCANFDVLGHEFGHTLIFAEVGTPNSGTNTAEYGGFHEAMGDLVALVSSLHFSQMTHKLLDSTKGNLFTVNELSRVGELDQVRQIRLAFNNEKMSTVSNQPHDLSKPLTGAIFDIMVEVFQKNLVSKGLISQDLADRSYNGALDDWGLAEEFGQAYTGNEQGFEDALIDARDYLGKVMAASWQEISANNLSYLGVALALIDADSILTGGAHHQTIRECFLWREISLSSELLSLQQRGLMDCFPG